ncbi:2-dehydropantoate 2-reductase [Jiella sonneratiae]|uniref:2-dehydropantoate 2-reductase n=1 Tax=Jiella sonneratiae TaxID=2816856 RepID=A0ABS3IZG6_9HYPH|nr:2-dehydropantoate 2-reductase [Jiella sonneratiae]MBO0902820.1 2-dehydropantoate 2-reductase [Jiella sonneratiae]
MTKTAVIGAGAIGGYLAAMLADAGHEVTLCVRTPFEELTLEDEGSRRKVAAAIAADPDAIADASKPCDLVVVATKAQDTASARPWLEVLAGERTLVLMAQNGVDHAARIAEFGLAGTVVPSVVYVAAERVSPGAIVHHYSSRIIVPDDAAGRRVADLFAGSALSVERVPDFVTVAWRKLLSNVVANPVTALTLRRMDVFRDEAVQRLGIALLAEAVAAGRAAGAEFGEDELERTLKLYDGVNPESGSSMLYDRLAGRPLEHAYLTGAVVAAGRRHGVPTPLNAAILALLGAVDRTPIERP